MDFNISLENHLIIHPVPVFFIMNGLGSRGHLLSICESQGSTSYHILPRALPGVTSSTVGSGPQIPPDVVPNNNKIVCVAD